MSEEILRTWLRRPPGRSPCKVWSRAHSTGSSIQQAGPLSRRRRKCLIRPSAHADWPETNVTTVSPRLPGLNASVSASRCGSRPSGCPHQGADCNGFGRGLAASRSLNPFAGGLPFRIGPQSRTGRTNLPGHRARLIGRGGVPPFRSARRRSIRQRKPAGQARAPRRRVPVCRRGHEVRRDPLKYAGVPSTTDLADRGIAIAMIDRPFRDQAKISTTTRPVAAEDVRGLDTGAHAEAMDGAERVRDLGQRRSQARPAQPPARAADRLPASSSYCGTHEAMTGTPRTSSIVKNYDLPSARSSSSTRLVGDRPAP